MRLLQRHVALPADHGSWAFFLKPLLIGLFAGGRWHTTVVYLTIASACAFLIRQPISLAVKAYAGRRSREILPAAFFWIAVYGTVSAVHVTGLVLRGFGYLLLLAVPGMLVFTWYLLLLARREERRQELLEILATGALALVAPAGMWAGLERPDAHGWLLWLLVWAQSATAIVYVYFRLSQRKRTEGSPKRGIAALITALSSLALASCLGFAGLVSRWLVAPFAVQALEVGWGLWHPAAGLKPTAIGIRQLVVTSIFTVLFVLLW